MKKIEKHFNDYDCYATEKPNGNYNLSIYMSNSTWCFVEKEVTKGTMEVILEDELHCQVAIDLILSMLPIGGSPVDCKFIG